MFNYKLYLTISLILTLSWMGVIYCFSSMDTNESNSKSINTINKVVKKSLDVNNTNKNIETEKKNNIKAKEISSRLNLPLRKVMHGSIYFILGLLLINLFKVSYYKRYYLYSLIICFIYACSDEFHQSFVFGRTASYKDVLIDTCGCIIAIFLVYMISKLNKKEVI